MEVVSSPSAEVRPPEPSPDVAISLGSAWGYLVKLLLLMLGAGAVVVMIFSGLLGMSSDDPLVTLIGYVAPFLAYGLLLRHKAQLEPLLQFPVNKKQPPVLLFFLLLLLVPSVQVVLDPLISLIPIPDSMKEVFESRMGGSSVFTILTVVVAAPILEEFVLRGQLLRGLLQQYSPARAIIWTSLMFAILHLNPWQGIGAFALGLVLGWVYYRTGSLLACIFFHFANNLFATVMGLVTPESTDKYANLYVQLGDATTFVLVYVAAVVVLVLCLVLMRKVFRSMGEGMRVVQV